MLISHYIIVDTNCQESQSYSNSFVRFDILVKYAIISDSVKQDSKLMFGAFAWTFVSGRFLFLEVALSLAFKINKPSSKERKQGNE